MNKILGAEGKFGFVIKICDSDQCGIKKNSSGMYVQVAIFSMVALIRRVRLVKC